MANYWNTYRDAMQAPDARTRRKLFMECIMQNKEPELSCQASFDMGEMLYFGTHGETQDKERGLTMIRSAVLKDHGDAMALYGRDLVQQGDRKGIDYLCMGLIKGVPAAGHCLQGVYRVAQAVGEMDLYAYTEDSIDTLLSGQRSQEAGDSTGSVCLTLALIGLYGLGEKFGLSTAQGEEYLQKAAAKGHPMAALIRTCPDMKAAAALRLPAAPSQPKKKKSLFGR